MKQFYPTYLYVKTHNVTGLKYFGKTSKDPMKYRGSGKYWLRHLDKHGNDVSTEILGFYTDKTECEAAALQFSIDNNITESNIWANMIVENGLDGGYTGHREYTPLSETTRKKLSVALIGRVAWNKGLTGVTPGNTKPRSEETKRKISEAIKGTKRTAASIEKAASKLRGRKRPDVSERLKGRTVSESTKEKIAKANRGKIASAETKQKIREARAKQIFTDETKQKLSGKVVVINKQGELSKISKEIYYSQTGPKEDWEWVMHRSAEAKIRKKG
jgi:hypothetical protein